MCARMCCCRTSLFEECVNVSNATYVPSLVGRAAQSCLAAACGCPLSAPLAALRSLSSSRPSFIFSCCFCFSWSSKSPLSARASFFLTSSLMLPNPSSCCLWPGATRRWPSLLASLGRGLAVELLHAYGPILSGSTGLSAAEGAGRSLRVRGSSACLRLFQAQVGEALRWKAGAVQWLSLITSR